MIEAIRACVFDVFGTVVDWHGSVSRDLAGFAEQRGIASSPLGQGAGIDWVRFTEDWRRLYNPAMEEVRSGRRAWTILDVLHRESLVHLLAEYGIDGCTDADIDHMNRSWHRLDPWPDAVPGLTRLKAEYVIVDLAPDYSRTIIGRSKRDYVWLMARTPRLSDAELQAAIAAIAAMGYDTSKLRMVPQSAATR